MNLHIYCKNKQYLIFIDLFLVVSNEEIYTYS